MGRGVLVDTATIDLTRVTCGKCGGTYALAARYVRDKSDRGGFWTCPYCKCSWGYPRNGCELERTKRQLANERARHDQTRADRDHIEARRRGEKAAKTRLQRKIADGQCPCCDGQFKNVRRHMQRMHPEYVEEARHDR